MNEKSEKTFISVVLVSLMAVSCNFFTQVPQEEKGPRIFGIVTDEDSVGLAGVAVATLDGNLSCQTDSLGRFRFDSLENGSYVLQFSLRGYASDTIHSIELSEEKPGSKCLVVLQYASVPRAVSGSFTYRFLMTGAVYAVLTGDSIEAAKPRKARLTYDSALNSFSGIIRQPESGSKWNLQILVYGFDSMAVGETNIPLAADNGAITIPSFFPINKIAFLYNDSTSAGEYFDFISLTDGQYTMISKRAIRTIDSNGILLGTWPVGNFASVSGNGGIYSSAKLHNCDLIIGGTPDSSAGAGIFLARITPEHTFVWSKKYDIDSSIAWPLYIQDHADGTISIDIHVSGGGNSSGKMTIKDDGTVQESISMVAGETTSDKLHFFDLRNSYRWEYFATITNGLSYSVRYTDGGGGELRTSWSGPSIIPPFIDTWGDNCTLFLIRSQESKKTWMLSVAPIANYKTHYYMDGMAPVCRTSATSYLICGALHMEDQGLGFVLMLKDETFDESEAHIKGLLSFPEVPMKMLKIRDKQYIGAGRTSAFSTDSHLQPFMLKMHENVIEK